MEQETTPKTDLLILLTVLRAVLDLTVASSMKHHKLNQLLSECMSDSESLLD